MIYSSYSSSYIANASQKENPPHDSESLYLLVLRLSLVTLFVFKYLDINRQRVVANRYVFLRWLLYHLKRDIARLYALFAGVTPDTSKSVSVVTTTFAESAVNGGYL